jgi:hypothetical protein
VWYRTSAREVSDVTLEIQSFAEKRCSESWSRNTRQGLRLERASSTNGRYFEVRLFLSICLTVLNSAKQNSATAYAAGHSRTTPAKAVRRNSGYAPPDSTVPPPVTLSLRHNYGATLLFRHLEGSFSLLCGMYY